MTWPRDTRLPVSLRLRIVRPIGRQTLTLSRAEDRPKPLKIPTLDKLLPRSR